MITDNLMTDTDLIIAIAEFDGWKNVEHLNEYSDFMWAPGHISRAKVIWKRGIDCCIELPNYLTDLNAMHEVEKKLKPEQTSKYENFLALAVFKDDKDEYWTGGIKHIQAYCFHATAHQRAEALVRTIGKWKD